MRPIGYVVSTGLVALTLALGAPDVWAQARGHSGGGGGGSRPSSGGGGGGGQAVPRGGSGGGGGSSVSSGSGSTHSSGGSRARGSGGSTRSGSGGSAVDRGGSRSNEGNPVIGSATERTRPYYRPGGHSYYPYDPYYLYGYGAFGLGSFYYDPFWWGYPYGGYGYPYGGYYDRDELQDGVKGGLKLKVSPEDAEVHVDGYYVGRVDEFNGVFQRLNLLAGPHRLEIRAPGYETLTVDVQVQPRETISYHGALQPLGAR